jgi:hypothetical protein
MPGNLGSPAFDSAVVTGYYGPYSLQRIASANTTNATLVFAGIGTVGGWFLSNKNAAARFFKFYDLARVPVVGTDTPLFTIPIAPSANPPSFISISDIFFVNGVAFAITTGIADTDTGAVGTDDVHGFFQFTQRSF